MNRNNQRLLTPITMIIGALFWKPFKSGNYRLTKYLFAAGIYFLVVARSVYADNGTENKPNVIWFNG